MAWRDHVARISQYEQSTAGRIRHTKRLGIGFKTVLGSQLVEVDGVVGHCDKAKSIWTKLCSGSDIPKGQAYAVKTGHLTMMEENQRLHWAAD